MSNSINVMAIVEGKTEEIFIKNIVSPYLAKENIFIQATQVSKPGQKGGDVRFDRIKRDLEIHLKQRSDTYVTLFVDYYGIKQDWPGIDLIRKGALSSEISDKINNATKKEVINLFGNQRAEKRFIPFIAVYEFEALLFSDPEILSSKLEIDVSKVKDVLKEFGQPEEINNSPQTAPSKRLDSWARNNKFPKTTVGIMIAKEIGINKIRKECPLFNEWLAKLESLKTQ